MGQMQTNQDTDDQTLCAFRVQQVGGPGRENRCSASRWWWIRASRDGYRTYRVGWQPLAGSFILTHSCHRLLAAIKVGFLQQQT